DENYSADLNTVPVGTGYTPAIVSACMNTALTASATTIGNNCRASASAITAARPYNASFPYLNYIVRTTSGFKSNYNGLQVTVDQRDFHGVRFLAAYTYAHALDMWTKTSQGTQQVADPVNGFNASYASSDQDVRHRFRFAPSYDLPGIKSPGQMLEGWR